MRRLRPLARIYAEGTPAAPTASWAGSSALAVMPSFWKTCRRWVSTVPAGPELAEFCRGRLAAYKIPVRWLFTDSFPLTSTGKIRKAELSARLADSPN